ncbi:PSD1 and planctomycete cytochrome C domain-containing protein [Neorhodopirellula pilleata]|uniref:Planctomycete cytochrome C n=1 Tax=Neorhodopirellula pilleata TaxID=2714738 RepID=A0A5C5YQI7_9BACT|nr:PSD1 and planctomycete cytochrome C domain-containing protein [Neorhodopirellula pilleata]TWT77175.1 Planctomycete cytochrome C [Neorhodopirellula pilleata]
MLLTVLWNLPAHADDSAFFHEYIEPILQNNCYDCHSHDSGEASGGLVLDSKAGWTAGGDSGPAIVPSQLDKSLLWQVVNHEVAGLEMPPDGKLPERDRTLIKKWIESGAVDPREDGRAADRKTIDIEAGRQWWSFRPLSGTVVPTVNATKNNATQSEEHCDTMIDSFVNEKLAEAGLSPAQRADNATLARRVSYDLTGLPPAPRTTSRHDLSDPDQYAAYVDSLLASPGFGEKWGRHWLDVARYADSNGSSFNVPFHNAWRYRNWVIDAINRNMPVDEFIRKQIAGDLLPAESQTERDENFIATGYLLLGSKVLGTFDKEQLTLDVIDEQIDTIGKSLLGMTLGCARCHDHKFDPLPHADYYALAGIMASTSTLVDRIGGPKDDESDWERRGLGPGGDEQLTAFLKENRYRWVKAVGKRFQAQKKLDELRGGNFQSPTNPTSDPDGRAEIDEERRLKVAAIKESRGGDFQSPMNPTSDPDRCAEIDEERRLKVAATEEELREAERTLAELLDEMPPHAMAVRDADVITDLEIRIRGVASSKGPLVPRGFLQVASFPSQPEIPTNQSGRLELAAWITSPLNPLTARVHVNRVWKHLFREGLVRSVDNFGTTGEKPSHPELLDDLAIRFIAAGWDLKRLVREIVLSDAYCRTVEAANTADPENRLLAHQNRRRLEAEEIRDTLLSLRGKLQCGPNENILQSLPIGDASNLGDYLNIQDNRRTVYQPVIRTVEPHVLQLFDAASNTMVTGSRPRTIVAPQSLYFLNSEFVQTSAEEIGNQILSRYTGPENESLSPEAYGKVLDDLINDVMQTIVSTRIIHQGRNRFCVLRFGHCETQRSGLRV